MLGPVQGSLYQNWNVIITLKALSVDIWMQGVKVCLWFSILRDLATIKFQLNFGISANISETILRANNMPVTLGTIHITKQLYICIL